MQVQHVAPHAVPQRHVETPTRTPTRTVAPRTSVAPRPSPPPVRTAETAAPRTDTLELSSRSTSSSTASNVQVYDRNGVVRNLTNNAPAAQGSVVKADLPWAGQVNAASVPGAESRFEMPIPTRQEAKDGIIGFVGLGLLTAGAVVAGPAIAGALGLTGEGTSAAAGAGTAAVAGAGAAVASNDAASVRMAQEAAMPGATPVQPEAANTGYAYPPYDANYPIVDRPTQAGESFVRVSADEKGATGAWMMKASDVQGMSAQDIKTAWNIPGDVNFRTDVNPSEGTTVRVGVASGHGSTPFDGEGNQVQYEIQGEVNPDWFTNTTPLQK